MEKPPGKDAASQEITGWAGPSAGPQGCFPRPSRQDVKGRLAWGRWAGAICDKEADVWEGRPSVCANGSLGDHSQQTPRVKAGLRVEGLLMEPDPCGGTTGQDTLS